jgi:hypothetical protein
VPFSKSRFRTRAAGEAVANPEVLLLLDAGSTVALIFRPNVLQESTGRCSDEEGITPTIAVPPALLQAERGRAPRGRMVVADRATVVVGYLGMVQRWLGSVPIVTFEPPSLQH